MPGPRSLHDRRGLSDIIFAVFLAAIFYYTNMYQTLKSCVTRRLLYFVQDSSIGDLVTHSLINWLIFWFKQYNDYNALCSKGCHLKKKNYHEMFNFENWFLCQFSSNTRFSFGVGSLNTPKIGKRKKEFTNINLRGFKTQKREGGVFHG